MDYGNDVPHASELFKEQGDEDTTDKAERIERKRRKLKDGVPYHSQPFCIKTLCEYEGVRAFYYGKNLHPYALNDLVNSKLMVFEMSPPPLKR